jgi:hypothetical protein
VHFDEYLVKKTYYLPKETSNAAGRPALIMGTLHKKGGVLIWYKGGGEAIVPVLVFLYST